MNGRVTYEELVERSVLIETVDVPEVANKLAIVKKVGLKGIKTAVSKFVRRENVADGDFTFETKPNVVGEQKKIIDCQQVTRDTIVVRRDALCLQQRRFDRTENVFSKFVEQFQPTSQLGAVLLKTLANDLVGTSGKAVVRRLGSVVLKLFFWCHAAISAR